MAQHQIAFVGAGNMASSLIGGMLDSGIAADAIRAADPDPEQRQRIAKLGITTTDDNVEACRGSDTIVLAVKPQVLGQAVESIAKVLQADQLLISIAAGVPSTAIRRWAGRDVGVVRCMPNTPALVGAGMAALFANPAVTAPQRDQAAAILNTVGETLWVDDEADLDAVTALSGSGPAYFFYLMEAMVDTGVGFGLSPDCARTLTLQTAYGASLMALRGDQPPASLRRNVTSPGGTTEAALKIFENNNLTDTIRAALEAALYRSEELAVEFGASEPRDSSQ